jgi:hypothetical protein
MTVRHYEFTMKVRFLINDDEAESFDEFDADEAAWMIMDGDLEGVTATNGYKYVQTMPNTMNLEYIQRQKKEGTTNA